MTVSGFPTLAPLKFPLFGTAPFRRVAQHLKVPVWHDRRYGILAIVLLGWLPLIVLSAIEHRLFAGPLPAYSDFSLHARLLGALPALLLGKLVTDRLFARAVEYLVESGAVTEASRARFDASLRRVQRLRDSWPLMLLLVFVAYAITAVELGRPVTYVGSWKVQPEGGLSLGGYWYFVVARPLVVTHFLAWVWTFGLWSWLLIRFVRLPLKLLAFHPDGAGGLEPVLSVHRTFMVISFAIGTDLGGSLANRMVHMNEPHTTYTTLLVVVVIVLTLVLLAPLVLLSRLLIPARYDAIEQFGAMTFELSRMLERDSHLEARTGLDDRKLNLIRSFGLAHGGHAVITGTHLVPITRKYVLSFLLAPAVPIALALLTRIPLLTLVQQLRQLMHY